MLMQFFLIYFDELIGKDLGFWIYLQLFLYFGINATPLAFPLATLVASLMIFGSLGEQLELTALKSAGIPFIRVLRPLFLLICLISFFLYFSNGYLVPKVNVKAYTLLWDLRKKKPSIAIKEGVFYNGIPDYSILVQKKLPDEKTLEDIIIYDHTKNKGNVHLTTANSGKLTTTQGEQYLVIELFDGHNYIEELPEKNKEKATSTPDKPLIPQFYRASFQSQKILIDLDELKLTRTSEKLFAYHHNTKTNRQLIEDISKKKQKIRNNQQEILESFRQHYHLPVIDSVIHITEAASTESTTATDNLIDSTTEFLPTIDLNHSTASAEVHEVPQKKLPITHELDQYPNRRQIIQKALAQARDLKYKLQPQVNKINSISKDLREFQIEKHKRAAYALGCVIMLLIGASLGSLIKKGGLGVPLLISTAFILIYYMADMFGTKWAKADLIGPLLGAWAPNMVLIPFGLFFLRHAQKDTRILEGDAYHILWRRIGGWFRPTRKG